ncbi:tartrate dehydrogenase [Nitratireductor pacificus pht-3B]|uniref:Tartrate dehydrogenase n=2 Tax=Nitratireductor TaxID=245876 RepID=K2MID2_9HYPH|nr:tartrate dehydrogenase [Nitratireductor pacificus pht-3B]
MMHMCKDRIAATPAEGIDPQSIEASVGAEQIFSSILEPLHDLARRRPVGGLQTQSQSSRCRHMLDHVGEADADTDVMPGVESICDRAMMTADVCGTAPSCKATDAVIDTRLSANLRTACAERNLK